jgi:hypothetical protein
VRKEVEKQRANLASQKKQVQAALAAAALQAQEEEQRVEVARAALVKVG